MCLLARQDSPYLFEAGPGTEKTQTLTGRVVQLLDKGVDPKKLLVLTYAELVGESDRRRRGDAAAGLSQVRLRAQRVL
ncbi:UvrD-helicase domain-containing protein [uncultured Sphingomonas sp.]|uniref:UvrD-helicase domain-containing protein n=1 Tax=uncultured Sphingomonas sp. TaxID=158754 RepID=UPI0035CB645D